MRNIFWYNIFRDISVRVQKLQHKTNQPITVKTPKIPDEYLAKKLDFFSLHIFSKFKNPEELLY